jgi:Reverse transcriptase (RNA-dependent DNA polymerase)
LIKSLYGLKQASRCWNNLINDYLRESGFQRLEADPCIYVREITVVVNGQKVIKFQIVALYVDDLIIAASNKNLITDLEKVFEARFKVKKLNKIKHILGMGVYHDKDRNIINITQQQYIEESAKRFAKYGISEFRTSMDDRLQLSKQQMPKEGSPEALQMATFSFRELIGTLLWISNGTRPDIVFPVNTLAKYTHNLALLHWRAALRVLVYLKTTKNYCIRYAQQIHQDNIVSTGYMRGILPEQSDFKCYVDASHASDLDTRRSITG